MAFQLLYATQDGGLPDEQASLPANLGCEKMNSWMTIKSRPAPVKTLLNGEFWAKDASSGPSNSTT